MRDGVLSIAMFVGATILIASTYVRCSDHSGLSCADESNLTHQDACPEQYLR